MITNFRHSIYGLFTKTLLILVVISFIFWGIGTNSPTRSEFVAKIDKNHYIYTDQFNQQRKNLVHSIVTMNPNISLDNLDVNSIVLNSMIRNKILEIEYERMGIFISDDMAKKEISKNRFFFNKDGKFDRDLFRRIVINQGMQEKDYVEQQKMLVATQIFDSAVVPFTAPESMVKDLYQFKNQERTLRLIHIKPHLDKKDYIPTTEEIQKYYNEYHSQFTQPEKRDIEFLIISPQNFVKNNKNDLNAAEKEMHKTIKEIEDELASGESLSAIAKKYKITYDNINNFSQNTKTQIPRTVKNEDIAKFISLAFESDTENTPSDAIQVSNNSNEYYIFNTKKIYASQTPPLDQVKKDIIKILNNQEQKIIIKQKASDIFRKFVVAPQKLNDFLKQNKNTVSEDTVTTKRQSQKIAPTLLEESFSLKQIGSFTNMIQISDKEFIFAILDKVTMPTANNISDTTKAELQKTVSDAVNTATHNEMLRYIYNQHTIEVRKLPNLTPQT